MINITEAFQKLNIKVEKLTDHTKTINLKDNTVVLTWGIYCLNSLIPTVSNKVHRYFIIQPDVAFNYSNYDQVKTRAVAYFKKTTLDTVLIKQHVTSTGLLISLCQNLQG